MQPWGAGETFEFAYKMGCISIRLAGVQGSHEHLTPELLKRESQVLDSSFYLEDAQEQDNFSNYDIDKKINTRTKHFRSSFRVSSSMGEIRVIGPINSGKTTFLAALADWHDIGFRKPIKAVEPLNEESSRLRWKVANILQQGAQLEPTLFCVEYPPSYLFNIEITPNFWHNPLCWLRRRNIQFSITCKDFAGEFIQGLTNSTRTSRDYLENYLNDCAFATCLLVMIDGSNSEDRDRVYSQAFSVLRKELSSRARRGSRRFAYRIAIVFSKADQPPIWQYRYRLMEFVNKKFPYTKSIFQEWCNDPYCSISVAYFACSAFGMRGKPPQPNVSVYDDRGNCGGIEDPSVWQPFGLAAPIYWLSIGKRDSRLEKC